MINESLRSFHITIGLLCTVETRDYEFTLCSLHIAEKESHAGVKRISWTVFFYYELSKRSWTPVLQGHNNKKIK